MSIYMADSNVYVACMYVCIIVYIYIDSFIYICSM